MTNTRRIDEIRELVMRLNQSATCEHATVRGRTFQVYGTDIRFEFKKNKSGELRGFCYNVSGEPFDNPSQEELDHYFPDYEANPRLRYTLIQIRDWVKARSAGLYRFANHRDPRTKR